MYVCIYIYTCIWIERYIYIYIVHTCSITHIYIYVHTYIRIFVIMYVAICCMYMLCFHGEPHKMGSIPKILWHPWWVSHCWDSPIQLGLIYPGEFRFFYGGRLYDLIWPVSFGNFGMTWWVRWRFHTENSGLLGCWVPKFQGSHKDRLNSTTICRKRSYIAEDTGTVF